MNTLRISDPPTYNHKESDTQLKFWIWMSLGMALFTDAVRLLLTGTTTLTKYIPSFENLHNGLSFIGFVAGMPAGVMLIGYKRTPIRPIWLKIALLAGFSGYFYEVFTENSARIPDYLTAVAIILIPLGCLFLVSAIIIQLFRPTIENKQWALHYWQISALFLALSIATMSGLSDNLLTLPITWDYFVYHIDEAFGGLATKAATLHGQSAPFFQTATGTIYGVINIAMYATIGLTIREQAISRLHVWRTFVVPYMLAIPLYSLIPLCGPIATFVDGNFPYNVPPASQVPTSEVILPYAFRNAMPSMHLTGAILIWQLTIGLRHRVAILLSTLFTFGTSWTTLATGEHYCLDLVVALPFSAFLGSALIWPQLLRSNWRIAISSWLAGFTFVIWLVLIRVVPAWLADHLWFVRLFSAWGILCTFTVFLRMIQVSYDLIPSVLLSSTSVNIKQNEPTLKTPVWIIGLFAVSGLAGLVYEVVYAKALAITFGSTALATYTVLATYMGGMSLGAWLGGFMADRVRVPLYAYALCEMVIGIYATITPKLFILIQQVYTHFSLDEPPDASWLTFLRVGLGALCLGIPTVLMGATMPLMFKHLRSLGISSRHAIAPLYGANVAGAALGSIIAGYFILPSVGRMSGTYLAAVISLMVALFVVDRLRQGKQGLQVVNTTTSIEPESGIGETIHKWHGLTALAALFIGGIVTLGLEVNFMHLLAVVAGNSVYAFGLMLATFLAGLGLGSFFGEKLMGYFSRLDLIAWSQCGIALAIGITAHVWDDIPFYFASFSMYKVPFDFTARETIRAMVCASAMLPTAFFIGTNYPAAMSMASDWLSPKGGARGLGVASCLNTLGNILGVILVGFWLLPNYGSRDTSLVLALTAFVLALATLLVNKDKFVTVQKLNLENSLRWAPAMLAGFVLALFPKQWNYDDLSTGSNVYFAAQNWGKVIDHAESVEGGLTLIAKNKEGVSTLLTNGKFQGNNASKGEMLAQESFALFPLLHTDDRDNALVIGYGTGMTTRVLHEAGFKQIHIAELSRDIVTMANRHFNSINHTVTDKPGVNVHYTDGRNYLLTQSRKFDVISIEVTSIWFAGAANLYNKEFYALAKQRLTDKGVLQQWLQLHHMSAIDLAYAIGSVRSEFKYVWLYVRGSQGIIVASNSETALKESDSPIVKTKTQTSESDISPKDLRSYLLLSPASTDRFIKSIDPNMNFLISTDNNLYLEYSTPKGNALGDVLDSNIQTLKRLSKEQVLSLKN